MEIVDFYELAAVKKGRGNVRIIFDC